MYDSLSDCAVIANMCFAVAMIISEAALWGVEEKTSDYKVDN